MVVQHSTCHYISFLNGKNLMPKFAQMLILKPEKWETQKRDGDRLGFPNFPN